MRLLLAIGWLWQLSTQLSSAVLIRPEVVQAPHFIAIPPLNTTDQSPQSLVDQLQVVVFRDTSVTIQWVLQVTPQRVGFPVSFEIELSTGNINQDYSLIENVKASTISASIPGGGYLEEYTIESLLPLRTYRVRIAPVFKTGRGYVSSPLTFTTISAPVNYWEPVIPRRSSEGTYFRGFSDPVLTRPHLTQGVEVFGGRTHASPVGWVNDTLTDTAAWYSDPPTSEAHELPSGRRGNSLSLIEGKVYMFGGRTNGYSCASVLKDTINLGLGNSGIDTYPCVSLQAEVNEVWSFDLDSYTWKYLNTSKYQISAPPPPREQHSAGSIDGNLYIFGGKSRLHPKAADGTPIMTNAANTIYGDLWVLMMEHPTLYGYSWPVPNGNQIAQDKSLKAVINATLFGVPPLTYITPRDGYCLNNITVKVTFEHPCITQIRMSLLGPGPLTGSPNFFPPDDGLEVLLMSDVAVNSTYCVGGNHTLVFNDAFERDPSACCSTEFNGDYKPAGKLSEFLGSTMLADWTLVIQDMKQDALVGTLHSYEIEFVSTPCFPSYQWENLTAIMIGDRPSPRYDGQMVAYNKSIFVYGGRDSMDVPISDLYRFDTATHRWTELLPVNFQTPLLATPTTTWGYSLSLTSWGLFKFGGYARIPTLMISPQNPNGGMYGNDMSLMDPVTGRWTSVVVDTKNAYDTLFGQRLPRGRYLSSVAFIPASSFQWRSRLSERLLYDQAARSYQTNLQGSVADSIMMFGGFDGATGGATDGSLGGYFNDIWMLRLNAMSTAEAHRLQKTYQQKHCSWRMTHGAQLAGSTSCLSSSHLARCDMRDLIMLPWCASFNQTLS